MDKQPLIGDNSFEKALYDIEVNQRCLYSLLRDTTIENWIRTEPMYRSVLIKIDDYMMYLFVYMDRDMRQKRSCRQFLKHYNIAFTEVTDERNVNKRYIVLRGNDFQKIVSIMKSRHCTTIKICSVHNFDIMSNILAAYMETLTFLTSVVNLSNKKRQKAETIHKRLGQCIGHICKVKMNALNAAPKRLLDSTVPIIGLYRCNEQQKWYMVRDSTNTGPPQKNYYLKR